LLRSNARGSKEDTWHEGRLRARFWTALVAAGTLALSGMVAAASASAQPRQLAAASPAGARHVHVTGHLHRLAGHHDYQAACAAAKALHFSCLALVRTSVNAHRQPGGGPSLGGFGPASLQSAYSLPSSTAGSGQTVAVVDAYNDPDITSDLATYRSHWGLPACGSGCFSVVNEDGQASPLPADAGSTGWDVEESLDVDMVSAICPLCQIILVEADSPDVSDLGTAVNSAVSLGAKFVSNSYGGPESSTDTTYDTDYYNHPGVAVTASAGDDGYGVEYPAASQFVTAVGGTTLTTASSPRGWTETAWGSSTGGAGTGSGCSAYDPKPSWQTDTGCPDRTDNDVSAVADPNTGVAVYDSYSQRGWIEVGGTSASSPIIASTFALAGTPAPDTYPSSYPYADPGALNDVTSGANGSCGGTYLCTAQTGYDGPTGLGTPDGVTAFGSGLPINTVTVTNPGNQTGTVGTAVSLQISATDSQSGQTLTYTATGLPAGLSINPSSGLISGTPTTGGTSDVTVTATDTTGANGSTLFTWTVNAPPVTGLKATAKYTNLTATWNASPGATGYQVIVTTHQASITVAKTTVTGTSYHLGHLKEKSGYAVHVLALPAASGQKPATVYVTTK
jgi:subtilase family serine protease